MYYRRAWLRMGQIIAGGQSENFNDLESLRKACPLEAPDGFEIIPQLSCYVQTDGAGNYNVLEVKN